MARQTNRAACPVTECSWEIEDSDDEADIEEALLEHMDNDHGRVWFRI